MKNIPLLIGTIVGTLLLVVVLAVVFSSQQTSVSVISDEQLLTGATNNKGAENAKVTIVEFSDFQCPACRAAQPLVASILSQYPDEVRLVYRHFPLSTIHQNAQLAAQATEYAAGQGKFWELHDLLFERQSEWGQITDQNTLIETFTSYLDELAIDKTDFSTTILSDSLETKVLKDLAVGEQVRVTATPTFYVNGEKTAAPQLLTTVQSKLQQTEQ